MTRFYSITFFVLGICLGSGMNCLAYRLARGQDWVHGSSVCPSCGARLTALDLVPLFSWLFLGGKCRHCKKKISVRYPLTELISGLALLALYRKFGLTLEFGVDVVLYFCLLALSLVDLDTMEIPNGFLIIPAVLRMAFLLWQGGFRGLWYGVWHSLVLGGAMLLLVLLLEKILKKEAMGGGDIKLLFLLGLFLDLPESLLLLLFACVIGILFALILNGKESGKAFPFGPALSLAAMLVILWGEPIVNAYLGLFS